MRKIEKIKWFASIGVGTCGCAIFLIGVFTHLFPLIVLGSIWGVIGLVAMSALNRIHTEAK